MNHRGIPGWMSTVLAVSGIDGVIAFTVLNRGWQMLAGVLNLVLIARLMSPEEQGIYYTFLSVNASQVLFELGMGYVLSVCASHERADLTWSQNGTLEGPEHSRLRLGTLLRGVIRWYGGVGIATLVVLIPVGFAFFGHGQLANSHIEWRIPWVVLVAASALNLSAMALLAFFEGLGLVREVAVVRLVVSFVSSLAFWLSLASGLHLLAVGLMAVAGVVCCVFYLVLRRSNCLRSLLTFRGTAPANFSWRTEVWSFQWRIGLSWLSGFFIFQMFNPIVFKLLGPVAAGQMGMSLTALSGSLGIGLAWVNTKLPRFSTHIARREFRQLDELFFSSLRQACGLFLMTGAFLILVVWLLHVSGSPYQYRMLPLGAFALLTGKAISDQIVFCLAAYLRAHRREPLLVYSIANAVIVPSITYICARYYGTTGVAWGMFAFSIGIALPWCTGIFAGRRGEWHSSSFYPSALSQDFARSVNGKTFHQTELPDLQPSVPAATEQIR